MTSLVDRWPELLTTNHEIPGSIPRRGNHHEVCMVMWWHWGGGGICPLEEIQRTGRVSSVMMMIIIIFINCNWVFTRWQLLIYMYTVAAKFTSGGPHEKQVVKAREHFKPLVF
jgi:hypothetical protein